MGGRAQHDTHVVAAAVCVCVCQIMFDLNLKAWLIEVNSAPSLSASSESDRKLKMDLLDDMLTIVDVDRKLTGTGHSAPPAAPPINPSHGAPAVHGVCLSAARPTQSSASQRASTFAFQSPPRSAAVPRSWQRALCNTCRRRCCRDASWRVRFDLVWRAG